MPLDVRSRSDLVALNAQRAETLTPGSRPSAEKRGETQSVRKKSFGESYEASAGCYLQA